VISYSQNYEDVILDRAFGSKRSGFYVDVGAASPNEATVTRHFYELGWHGINIEPIPSWAKELAFNRPRDVNLQLAAGEHSGSFTLYRVVDDPSLSTLTPEVAARHRSDGLRVDEIDVEVRPLNDIFEDAGVSEIDFLKIDVEGAERDVLLGIDLDRYRPRVILVEAVEPYSLVSTAESFESLVTDHRYLFASNDGINRYYVREEDRALIPLLVPANAVDEFTPMRERLLEDEITRLRHYVRDLERSIAAGPMATQPGFPSVVGRHRARLPRRVAVVSAPCSGEADVARILGAGLHATSVEVHHPSDIRWPSLPDRTVLSIRWPRTERFREILGNAEFLPVVVGRHPFDVLLAMLRVAQVDRSTGRWLDGEYGDEQALVGATPLSDVFLDWACGPRARALLDITQSWWTDPAAVRVRYEDLSDPGRVMALLDDTVVAGALGELGRGPGVVVGDLEEIPGSWRRYLTGEVVAKLADVFGAFLTTLEYEPPTTADLPDASSAASAWKILAGE
jgi:FkbM family methyltransferase